MKLKQLTEINLRETSPQSLNKNWGDGFLINHNRIYRNIRSHTLSSGFQFDSNPSADFLVFPFSQLETILNQKKIPYLNNVDVIQNLLDKTNNQVEWEELTDGFRRNYLFHESCHAVSRSVASQFFNDIDKLIQVLLEESFANTCELMGVIEVKDKTHQHFFELNSYTYLFEARTYLLKASEVFGEVHVFQFLMICYFYANVLKNELSQNEFNLILSGLFVDKISKFSTDDKKVLRSLGKIPFTLDIRFRTHTTSLYLKMTRLKMNRSQLQSVGVPDSRLISYTKLLAQMALQN